jgi:pimeloyl-ACP methyl ester carboxylesterase
LEEIDMTSKTNTIVLIHGAWMTPRSWDPFRGFLAQQGYRVLTPPWPRLEGEVEEIRRDPSPMAGLGITEIVDAYEQIIRSLDEPPIIMGHSFGGLFVQMLHDRGLGAAGVAIDAAAPRGVLRLPFSQIRALSPVLLNPANVRRAVPLNFEQFNYAFANTMTEREAREAFQLNAVPAPGRIVFQAGLANLNPWAVTKVDYRNDRRAPLLLIAGSEDHIVPASVNRANMRKYRRSMATTDFVEFPGRSHLIVAQTGWDEVAEHALSWAQKHVALPTPVSSLGATA